MSFYYLGSPYSTYPLGRAMAHVEVCRAAALLIKARVPVFSPIAHFHQIAELGNIDPLDHGIWMVADEPLAAAAKGMIVLKLSEWEQSFGLSCEIPYFRHTGRPVIYMEPGIIPEEVRP